jgi:uncharacterized OB-fold protein
MTERALTVFACAVCGTAAFPRRLACPQCGCRDAREVDASEGVVEETTTVRHRAGEDGGAVMRLGTVRTQAGPRVIARLEGAADSGVVVRLYRKPDGAIVGVA